jgi:hypothetical protein
MRQAGLIAALTKPDAESGRAEWLARSGHKERFDTDRRHCIQDCRIYRSGENEFAENIASANRASEPQWQENRTKSLQPKSRRLQEAPTSWPCAAHIGPHQRGAAI